MVSLDEFCLNTGLWPEWYAIRVFYNRVGPLKETLDNAAIRYFYPMHLVEKCSDGGIIYVQEPLIKALVFAKTTASDLVTIQRKLPRQRRAVLRQEHRKTDRHPRGADG